MGKRASERIKKVMDEVASKDAKPKPFRVGNSRTKLTPAVRKPTYQCCLVKHEGDLPIYFRACPDCPLNGSKPLDNPV